ncbi:hypothetical protein scyTo_0025166, partial [Scyliorhinus torazame]|nr:hypothetical protein [Scyliorhinus torazame]
NILTSFLTPSTVRDRRPNDDIMKMFVGEGVKLPFSLKEESSGCEWTTQGKADWLDGQQIGDER